MCCSRGYAAPFLAPLQFSEPYAAYYSCAAEGRSFLMWALTAAALAAQMGWTDVMRLCPDGIEPRACWIVLRAVTSAQEERARIVFIFVPRRRHAVRGGLMPAGLGWSAQSSNGPRQRLCSPCDAAGRWGLSGAVR